ncbi:MAG: hypothetical protein ACE5MH_00025 [Terriglobia bacterium]
MPQRFFGWIFLLGGLVSLVACSGPIVPRGPEQLYRLAGEQINNENYVRALDTLARIARNSPDSRYGAKASLTRLALLAGLARSALTLGELYLEVREEVEAAAYRSELHTAAMNQFGLGQSWALALVEALDQQLPTLADKPFLMDPLLPTTPAPEHPALARLREGEPIPEPERRAIERAAGRRALAEVMAALAGAPGDFGRAYDALAQGNARLEPAAVFLAFGNELVSLGGLFGKKALNNPRYQRLFYERALALAERALAATTSPDSPRAQQAERLKRHCQEVLGVARAPRSQAYLFPHAASKFPVSQYEEPPRWTVSVWRRSTQCP